MCVGQVYNYLLETFHKYDTDHGGDISASELHEMLKADFGTGGEALAKLFEPGITPHHTGCAAILLLPDAPYRCARTIPARGPDPFVEGDGGGNPS